MGNWPKVWQDTFKRLDDLEKRMALIEESKAKNEPEPEPKPETKQEPKPAEYL